MKNLASILVMVMALLGGLQAQNSKVTSGVIAFDGGRYEEALEKLSTALENHENGSAVLKEKNIPKLHYYLSQTYLRIGQDTALLKQHPDAMLKAYDHLQKAKETDTSGKFKKQLTLAEQMLWPAIFNVGAMAYNEGKEDPAKYEYARQHFEKAVALSPEDINSVMMLGYTQWMTKDTLGALNSWQQTVDLYEANTPDEPNTDVASAYLLLATLYDLQGETGKALEIVQKGRGHFPDDEDLKRTELSIYQQHPDLFEEAEAKFKKAIEENPDDLVIQLAYAGMLQQAGHQDKALEIYQDVLAKDPDNIQANIQIGAHYVNIGAEINEAKMNMTNEAEIDEAAKKVEENLRKAYPYIKKLHELQPNEPEWINQLVSITLYLGMDEEAAKYIEKQKEVMSNQGGN
ncbi:MAG: hypothetical protein D6730_14615 [Bacteroidetes bacterium]|nr:MAG: hypothetical protein D6730_14615 [Bacteroidota bacterium]